MAREDWKFSLVFAQGQPLPEAAKLWQASEDAGLDMLGIADSPNMLRELYVSTTMCAINTEKVDIITYVTNPVTRHPSVTASAFMSLNELAPGRIGMGIGTGDSALWSIGQRGARVAAMREYILTVKALLRGEKVAWQDTVFEAAWSGIEPFNLPVYVACAGPKILRMAAEVADGAIVTMGFAPEDIVYVRNIVDEGLHASGRTANDFQIWWNAHMAFDDSVEAAAERSMGWSPYWLTMGSLEGKGIPENMKEKLRQLNADAHDLDAVYRSKDRQKTLVERAKTLGVYDWMLSRSPRLFGTPADIAARLNHLGREHDMKHWILFMISRSSWDASPHEERLDQIDMLGRQIIPILD